MDESNKTSTKELLTNYMKFFKEVRPDVIKENPTLKTHEIAREVSSIYHSLLEFAKSYD